MALGQEASRSLFLHVHCHTFTTLRLALLALYYGPYLAFLGSLVATLCLV